MNISHWPLSERPRERLLQNSAAALSNAELLAILLNHGSKGQSAVDLARTLLNHFKNLQALFAADVNALCEISGIGPAKYTRLQAALEIGKRYLQEPIQQTPQIISSHNVKQFLIANLRPFEREVFACLLLNSQHCIIHFEKLFFGTIHTSQVYPREIIKLGLKYNANAIIIAHNHPSGQPTPSSADYELTEQLAKILRTVDIRLLDHMVIGANQCYSMAERGELLSE